MKNLITTALLLTLCAAANAQTLSLAATTAPCNNDGVLTATATGLTPPLTFTYNTFGMAASTITHTGVGTTVDALTLYSGGPVNVMVTDGTGTAYSYFSGLPPLTYSLTTTPAVCPGLGTASVTVTGGTAPYTYSWFDVSLVSVGTTNPVSVPSGSYGVTVTDATGCTFGSLVYPDSAFVYVSAPFSLTTTTTPAGCTNGTATTTPSSGGTLPYSYLWSTGATTTSITGLSMGSYPVTVTDAAGCSASAYAYVPQTVTITAPTTPTPATCTATDGAIIAFGSGGVPPYSYLWNTGATTASQTGLAAGSYNVTVHDANGCIGYGSGYVSVSTPITATFSSTASSCTSPTGSASLTVSGGTAPYTYIWYTTPVQTTSTATGLSAGSYGFKVTDAVGCIRTGTVVVNPVNIITGSFSVIPATCTMSDGSLSITAGGGTTPYTYSWSTGATTSTASGLHSGSYNVTITDAAGCHINKSGHVPASSTVGIGISTTPASCIFNSDGASTASAYGGTAPYTYSWTGGATTATLSGVPTGYYWVHVSDAVGCVANAFVSVGYNAAATSCYCTIQGTIYQDANNNCTQDAGEAGIHNVQVYCSGRGYTYTDAAGHYSFKVPSGTYTITETVLAFYPLSTCQSNNIVVTAAASSGCVLTVNFGNTILPVHDMHISTWDYSFAIPGNPYNQITVLSNDGTVSETAPIAGYKTDGQLFAPTFVPGGIFSGGSNWYTTSAGTPSITPGASQTYYMNYSVPTSIPLGTSVVFKDSTANATPMTNWLTDYSPWNNVKNHTTVVIGSYDPNFKEVSPKGTGPAGNITLADTVLEYMVHFQNTGTYFAEDVVVIDTLDDNLDWTTLKPVYQSAPCKVTLEQAGSSKVAKFTFKNIHLPAQSMDDLRSNGMFTYTIKTRPSLAIGSQIRNRASIYFDYNAPILTNTTLNTIAAGTLGTPRITANVGEFKIYPNPASSTFSAVINSEAATTAQMAVSDITGKRLLTKTVSLTGGAQTIVTDVSQFASGIYFVTLNSNGKTQTQKLVVIN